MVSGRRRLGIRGVGLVGGGELSGDNRRFFHYFPPYKVTYFSAVSPRKIPLLIFTPSSPLPAIWGPESILRKNVRCALFAIPRHENPFYSKSRKNKKKKNT